LSIKITPSDKIPRLNSILAWREILGSFDMFTIDAETTSICTVCNNDKAKHYAKYGTIRCICKLQKEQYIYTHSSIMQDIKTPLNNVDLDMRQIWGNTENQDNLITTLDIVKEWLIWPNQWLFLGGNPGCGKTHILQSIAIILGNFAVYISANHFEYKIKEAIDKGTVTEILHILKGIPFLIMDDLGSEYYKNDSWVKSQIRNIIDHRYNQHDEKPTLFASNLNKEALRRYDQRTASRILDKSSGNIVIAMNIGDYRTDGD